MTDAVKPFETQQEVTAAYAMLRHDPWCNCGHCERVDRLVAVARAGLEDRERLDFVEQVRAPIEFPDDDRYARQEWTVRSLGVRVGGLQMHDLHFGDTLRDAIDAARKAVSARSGQGVSDG